MGRKLLTTTLAVLSFIQCISASNHSECAAALKAATVIFYVTFQASVICYHGTWSYYRTGNGTYKFSDVPANLCTHYIYAFAGLNSTTFEVEALDSWLDIDLGGYKDAVALKEVNPNLTVLLGIGGWDEGSAKYSTMAADPDKRATFIASLKSFAETYGFDGFDMDWEYPARRDTVYGSADKENFALLLQEMYAALNPQGLIITAAVSAVPEQIPISYNVSALSEYLEFINVMTYDFYGAWDNFTGHVSPLFGAARFEGTAYQNYSVNASILGWLESGAPPSKLALGVPFYGRTYNLSDASKTYPGAPTTSTGGPAGPYTNSSGSLGYNEVVETFKAGGWTKCWNFEQQVPYAYNDNTWLSYDNEVSIALKVLYAKSLGLGAVMMWSLETDDFLGESSGIKNPLLTTINAVLDV